MSSTPKTPSTKATGGDNLQMPEPSQQPKRLRGLHDRIAALLRKAADLKAKARAKKQKTAKIVSLLIASLAAILIFSSRPSNATIRLYTSIHV
ncbi:hypothetical protein U2F10_23710 [Leptothoe sp. EHU-05/26/07-4]